MRASDDEEDEEKDEDKEAGKIRNYFKVEEYQ